MWLPLKQINQLSISPVNDVSTNLAPQSISISKGLNPTTISDLTGIPRATVIRKLQVLLKKKLLNKNEKNLFSLPSPQKNSQAYNLLKKRFYHHQLQVRNLITEILNYTKVWLFRINNN